jgi:hypothetical protein
MKMKRLLLALVLVLAFTSVSWGQSPEPSVYFTFGVRGSGVLFAINSPMTAAQCSQVLNAPQIQETLAWHNAVGACGTLAEINAAVAKFNMRLVWRDLNQGCPKETI